MFGQERIGGHAFGLAIVVPLVGKVSVGDLVRGTVQAVDVLDVGKLVPGRVFRPVLAVGNQQQRANSYKHYMRESMKRSNIVGAHWFTFREQALTGRGDGENYQVGLVDICDIPYVEMVNAIRETGEMMYEFRDSYNPKKWVLLHFMPRLMRGV